MALRAVCRLKLSYFPEASESTQKILGYLKATLLKVHLLASLFQKGFEAAVILSKQAPGLAFGVLQLQLW